LPLANPPKSPFFKGGLAKRCRAISPFGKRGQGRIAGGEAPYGFVRRKTVKLGPYNYLVTFVKASRQILA
jgi:hypothetical protein